MRGVQGQFLHFRQLLLRFHVQDHILNYIYDTCSVRLLFEVLTVRHSMYKKCVLFPKNRCLPHEYAMVCQNPAHLPQEKSHWAFPVPDRKICGFPMVSFPLLYQIRDFSWCHLHSIRWFFINKDHSMIFILFQNKMCCRTGNCL